MHHRPLASCDALQCLTKLLPKKKQAKANVEMLSEDV